MTTYRRPVQIAVSLVLVLTMGYLALFSPFFTHTSHGVIKEIKGNGGDFTENASVARRLDVVFSEFPVGSYFSVTGKACTCHGGCSYYGECECISIYYDPEKNGQRVLLHSCQCMGFAHYMFYKLFGFIDRPEYSETVDQYYSLGSLKPSEMTVANVKNLFANAKTGANVRAKGTHSFIVLSTDDNGLYLYHANTGIACRVDCWYWTWEELTAKYKSCGFEYIHMPVNYPESTGTYVPPAVSQTPTVPENQPGQVRVNTGSSSLNLRSRPGTDSSVVASVPHGTYLNVTEVSDGWGKAVYNGNTGWVHLGYTVPVLKISLPEDRFYYYEGVTPDMTGITVTQLQTDWTEKVLPPSSYTLTYSAPEGGKYTATVTAGEQSRSFTMIGLPRGDMDRDGRITAGDATVLLQGIAPGGNLTVRQTEGADTDGNGKIERNDAVAIIDYLTGKRKRLASVQEGG